MILAVYLQCGSFARAAAMCNCGPDTFRRRFLKHGHVPGHKDRRSKVFWTFLMRRAYKKVSRVPDKCPKGCPGWDAEPSCIELGQRCIFATELDKDTRL